MMVISKNLLIFFVISFPALMFGRSVTHRKDKEQVQIDKEVLLEDEDYDEDDVLNLTPEEQKERLKLLVSKKIDANQDGFVDMKELKAWSLKAFDAFEVDDVSEEFQSADANKDGLVSWEEFADDLFGIDFSEATADKKALQQYKKEKKVYEAADLDKDGQLSLSEFINFRVPRAHLDTKQVVIIDALENYDTNKDNKIDVEEFLRETSHDSEDDDFIGTETDRFKEMDKNNDGFLAGEEVVYWMDPDNEEDANDEAEHLMSECDVNGDQKLSAKEIIDNHNLWVESDATDYGKQLLLNHDEF